VVSGVLAAVRVLTVIAMGAMRTYATVSPLATVEAVGMAALVVASRLMPDAEGGIVAQRVVVICFRSHRYLQCSRVNCDRSPGLEPAWPKVD
jgi:hypothetical protein